MFLLAPPNPPAFFQANSTRVSCVVQRLRTAWDLVPHWGSKCLFLSVKSVSNLFWVLRALTGPLVRRHQGASTFVHVQFSVHDRRPRLREIRFLIKPRIALVPFIILKRSPKSVTWNHRYLHVFKREVSPFPVHQTLSGFFQMAAAHPTVPLPHPCPEPCIRRFRDLVACSLSLL